MSKTYWKSETWADRVQEFLATPDDAGRFNWQFPMGVFGTLRRFQGNNPLMHRGKVSGHGLAFLPHFNAQGLSVRFEENSCAPFEMFFYEPDQWDRMIPNVDSLEGFSPTDYYGTQYAYGYFRTLVWLHRLPNDYSERWFPASGRANLGEYRNLLIDPATWGNYERVPCWVYSNRSSNRQVAPLATSPLIWPDASSTR